jgi:hypothetical protein
MTVPPSNWRGSVLNAAWTIVAVAVLLYISARLILDVLPVLIVVGVVGLLGFLGWSVYQFRRSRW